MSGYEVLPTVFGVLLAIWLVYEVKKSVTKKKEEPTDE